MYRENIEHPWSIPDDIHAAVDLENGRERGRIWRLTPPSFRAPKSPRLGTATTLELVATLENPNSWWRETAQRLLFERQDKAALTPLSHLLKHSARAQARVHALWTLAGLQALTDADLLGALIDKSPGVRENAIKLAEPRAAWETRDWDPSIWKTSPLLERLFALVSDPDAAVRMQLAFTLGEVNHPRTVHGLANLLFRDGRDPWILAAILSSCSDRSDQVIAHLMMDARMSDVNEVLRELARIIGSRGQREEMQRAVTSVWRGGTEDTWAAYTHGHRRYFKQVLRGLGEGLKPSSKSLTRVRWGRNRESIDRLLSLAATAAGDSLEPAESRLDAIRLLAFDEFNRVKATLTLLLNPSQPHDIQHAAVTTLRSFNEPDTAPLLLSHWGAATPAIRSEIVLAMLSGSSRVLPLLQAIESGAIPANQVPFAHRAALFRSGNAQVRDLAAKIFGSAAPPSRKAVLSKYEASLSLKGDAARGQKIFETACATCHRAGDLGKEVGPNLATIRQWNPEQILINILDPNREVAPNFLGYTVETKDGRTLDGIIAEESAASLTLKRAEGITETILRGDIDQISGSGLSLMPDGLENVITPEQMADLIAFLLAPQ
jgi:putative heme-binding domain-containing protein